MSAKLIADAMLGGLARWLRVLGVDVAYDLRWDDIGVAGHPFAQTLREIVEMAMGRKQAPVAVMQA